MSKVKVEVKFTVKFEQTIELEVDQEMVDLLDDNIFNTLDCGQKMTKKEEKVYELLMDHANLDHSNWCELEIDEVDEV